MADFAVILPAAGRSTRFGDPNRKKVEAELDGRAVWLRAADAFVGRADVRQVVVALAPEDREQFMAKHGAVVAFMGLAVVDGGPERFDTIELALAAVDPACEFVAIHDAARPCVPGPVIDAVFAAAREHGAAVPGLAVVDTLKRVGPDRRVIETVPRAGLYGVQTPQAFRRELLVRAYAARARDGSGPAITDDAQLVEAIDHPCVVVEGSATNLKITTRADLRLAEAILKARQARDRAAPAHPSADDPSDWH